MVYRAYVTEFKFIPSKYRWCFKTFRAEIGIFEKYPVNATTIDVLDPCVAKPPVAKVFSVRVT